jgi:prophage tail gpP-like protein
MEGQNIAQRKAQWMANRAWGRSYAARITVDSWRDRAGKLWTPNSLIDVHSPTLKIFNRQWIISEVSFCKTPGPTAGTSAELVVMPKEAFSVEPVSIPMDTDVWEATYGKRSTQTSANTSAGFV